MGINGTKVTKGQYSVLIKAWRNDGQFAASTRGEAAIVRELVKKWMRRAGTTDVGDEPVQNFELSVRGTHVAEQCAEDAGWSVG